MKKVRERTLEEILADPEERRTEVIDVDVGIDEDKAIKWMKYAIVGVLAVVALVALVTHMETVLKGFSVVGSVVFIGLIYFLPYVVADRRKHHQKSAILLLNLFFGWSVIGWLVALIWSATAVRKD